MSRSSSVVSSALLLRVRITVVPKRLKPLALEPTLFLLRASLPNRLALLRAFLARLLARQHLGFLLRLERERALVEANVEKRTKRRRVRRASRLFHQLRHHVQRLQRQITSLIRANGTRDGVSHRLCGGAGPGTRGEARAPRGRSASSLYATGNPSRSRAQTRARPQPSRPPLPALRSGLLASAAANHRADETLGGIFSRPASKSRSFCVSFVTFKRAPSPWGRILYPAAHAAKAPTPSKARTRAPPPYPDPPLASQPRAGPSIDSRGPRARLGSQAPRGFANGF